MARPNNNGVELNLVKPKTKNQNDFVKSLENHDVIIGEGCPGTGKTCLSISNACQYLISGKVSQILISRTIVTAGNDLGAFKGSLDEKINPYFMATTYYLEKILGKGYRSLLDNKIFLCPIELLRGRTYDSTFMILDEASNCSIQQLKLFITRMGINSKAIIIGDSRQSDNNGNGLKFCLNYLNNISNVSITKFGYEDILRNSKIEQILRVFDKECEYGNS